MKVELKGCALPCARQLAPILAPPGREAVRGAGRREEGEMRVWPTTKGDLKIHEINVRSRVKRRA